MERKIGEIFEYNGEWYQAVKSQGKCSSCDLFVDGHCISDFSLNGSCFYCHRKDGENIMFRKLEKVGEPYIAKNSIIGERLFQKYKLYKKDFFINEKNLLFTNFENTVGIEIKQNKEDMEEKKLNLKPFDIQKAREGKPVCTRDGRKARIICFDKQEGIPIVALVETKKNGRISEEIALFYINGRAISADIDSKYDLMMLPEKKEGWVNVYKDSVYDTKDEALIGRSGNGYIDTIKVSWSE